MTHRHRDAERFPISIVAERFGLTPQTIRMYEAHGLLDPERTEGGTRMYTHEDIQRLEQICHFVNDLGVNLAGVEVILKLQRRHAAEIARLQQEQRTARDQMSRAFQQLLVRLRQEWVRRVHHSENAVVPYHSTSLHIVIEDPQ